MSLYRCMDEECLWTGVTPEEWWHADGITFNTICPVCGEFAEMVDQDTPAPPSGKVSLN
jgi:hypothetical protein